MRMSRFHSDLQEMAIIESLPLRHTVWVAEKRGCIPPKIARNGHNSTISFLKPDRRSVLWRATGGAMESLSLEGTAQSAFKNSIRRMQCDHKPMTRRKRVKVRGLNLNWTERSVVGGWQPVGKQR
jgi:hypothetical protein